MFGKLMSSWIKCTCGKLNHTNLFADEKLCLIVEDDLLNRLSDRKPAEDAISTMVTSSDIFVRCSCGRIAIEDKKSAEITIYAREQP